LELGLWRRWVHDAALEAGLLLQLSREQLLAFMRLSGDLPTALDQIIKTFTGQPFTQPKAILLRVLGNLSRHKSHEVRQLCSAGITEISKLDDPVLNIGLKHLLN